MNPPTGGTSPAAAEHREPNEPLPEQREANELFLSNAGRISLFTDEAGRIATIDADHQTIARQPRDPIDL